MSATQLAETYEKLKELRRQRGLEPEIRDLLDRLADADERRQAAGAEHLVRHLDIRLLADRVFGDEKKAAAWLNRPSASLSGQKPIDLLQDELGAAVVREMLERIDHGIFA